MRFAIFAAALAATVAAQDTVPATIEQTITSATTTYTITRTVERVVQTQYATRNGTEVVPTATSVATLTLMPYSNGTASTYAPWATGMGNQTGHPMMPNSAGSMSLNTAVVAAAAGLACMLFV